MDDEEGKWSYVLYFYYALYSTCIWLLNTLTHVLLTTPFYGWENLDTRGQTAFPESHSQKPEGSTPSARQQSPPSLAPTHDVVLHTALLPDDGISRGAFSAAGTLVSV